MLRFWLSFVSLTCVAHGRQISKFVVAGASKRGWTTWTTAAVDKRVIAAVRQFIRSCNLPAAASVQRPGCLSVYLLSDPAGDGRAALPQERAPPLPRLRRLELRSVPFLGLLIAPASRVSIPCFLLWTPLAALDDYWKLNFTLQLDNPVCQQMMGKRERAI